MRRRKVSIFINTTISDGYTTV